MGRFILTGSSLLLALALAWGKNLNLFGPSNTTALTPYGYWPKACVHKLGPGEKIREVDNGVEVSTVNRR
jgi:hypothetical protein